MRDEMTRVWRKVYEQNYPRSLDHRSFYFKQQEKKNMLTKTMVRGPGHELAWLGGLCGEGR